MIRCSWIVLCSFVFISISFSQTGWQQIHDGTDGPTPRRGIAGIHDISNQRLVFQGGESPRARFFGETWVLDLQTNQWNSLAVSNPSARCHHTFVIEPSGIGALLFGGFPQTNELWHWDIENRSWSDITPETSPRPRCLHSSVICTSRNEMIVYGGLNGGFIPDLSDTWIFNIERQQWKQIQTEISPGFRYGHVAGLDETRNRMLVFGGFMNVSQNVNQNRNDMWEFDIDTQIWHRLEIQGQSPAARQFARGVTLPNRKGILLFGGLTNEGYSNELWFFRFGDDTWHEITVPGNLPKERSRHTLILNQEENRIWVGFGAGAEGEHFNDLWSLSLQELNNEDLSLSTQIQAWSIH